MHENLRDLDRVRSEIVAGRAPTDRNIAISRRRSFNAVRIIVAMPSSAVSTTMTETARRAVSAVPIKFQSDCRATPGKIADRASRRYSLMKR